MHDVTRFGDWLTRQIDNAGMTQTALTHTLGAAQQHYAQWIKGQRKPTPKQIADMASMFNVTEDFIYHLLGKIPPDIEAGLKHATPDVFRAVRLYL